MHKSNEPADRLPHSWNVLITMTFVLIGAGIAALWLLLSFLGSRPTDFTALTERSAEAVERILAGGEDGAAELEARAAEVREDDEARWTYREYALILPSFDAGAELLDRLVDEGLRQGFTVEEEHDTGALNLSAAGRLFARILLNAPAPSAAPPTVAEIPRAPEPVPTPPLIAEVPREPEVPAPPAAIAALPPDVPSRPMLPDLNLLPELEPAPETKAPSPPAASSDPAPPSTPEPVAVASVPAMSAPLPGAPSRIAIIVDDGGYGGEATEIILNLDPNLTLALLPHTPFAADIARRAAARGFEVMLHMPMEAESGAAAALNPLVVGMSPEQIAQVTETALAAVPGAVGVNNHEGSRYTGDSIAMRGFLEIVKERGMFFIDSRTSPLSVASDTARSLGIPTADRDVFLDNRSDPAYIRGQFNQLLAKARQRGWAIGICHFRIETARVLQSVLPGLRERENVVLVHASEFVK